MFCYQLYPFHWSAHTWPQISNWGLQESITKLELVKGTSLHQMTPLSQLASPDPFKISLMNESHNPFQTLWFMVINPNPYSNKGVRLGFKVRQVLSRGLTQIPLEPLPFPLRYRSVFKVGQVSPQGLAWLQLRPRLRPKPYPRVNQ